MYPLFVKKVCIDWNRVPANSYLNRIPALKDVDLRCADGPAVI